jgi:hypothetical protein
MAALDSVKSWMNFWGWSEGGGPGAVKRDIAGEAIAVHGDATWLKDVELASEKVERQAVIAELERRDALLKHL